MPQIQRMAWSFRQSRLGLGSFDPHVSWPWSIAEPTQASYTLPCILMRGVWLLGLARVSWTFHRPHSILQQSHCHNHHGSTAYHQGSRKWYPHQAWCRRHPLHSQFVQRWAETPHYTWGRYSKNQDFLFESAHPDYEDTHIMKFFVKTTLKISTNKTKNSVF